MEVFHLHLADGRLQPQMKLLCRSGQNHALAGNFLVVNPYVQLIPVYIHGQFIGLSRGAGKFVMRPVDFHIRLQQAVAFVGVHKAQMALEHGHRQTFFKVPVGSEDQPGAMPVLRIARDGDIRLINIGFPHAHGYVEGNQCAVRIGIHR